MASSAIDEDQRRTRIVEAALVESAVVPAIRDESVSVLRPGAVQSTYWGWKSSVVCTWPCWMRSTCGPRRDGKAK